MSFDQLVQSVMNDTVGAGGSLSAFRAELALCGTIIAILLLKVAAPRWKASAFYVTVFGLVAAMCFALGAAGVSPPWRWFSANAGAIPPVMGKAIFAGVLVTDSFTVVLRVLLLLFALLFAMFTYAAAAYDEEDLTEFYILMLGALVGMCLMISANHILIVMLGVEMASVPCYVLAGMKRNQPKSSEAALKYAVFGAGAAGVMLYGMSLLVGVLGSAHLPAMTANLATMFQTGGLGPEQTTVLILGGLMLMVGVAFKLSAVPFHFWAPDVFEGATAEVAAFLSVASKAAALGLLVRLATGFAFPADLYFHPGAASPRPDLITTTTIADLAPARQYIVVLLSVLAAVTCTFGNLAAYGQTNMKRLLAYSTIAHAGYMMMPVAAAVSLSGSADGGEAAREAIAALVVYIGIYLFMNLAAFAIVAFLRNAIHSEEIADYAGLIRRSPGLTVCMAIVLFSLVGLPPLAGFSAKATIFLALISAKLWVLLLVGALNTVLSLFYYLRVVKVMVVSPEPLYRRAPTIPLSSMAGLYCLSLTLPVVVLFFMLNGLLLWAKMAASALFLFH